MSKKPVAPASMQASTYIPESPLPPRLHRDLCSTCRHAGACGSRSTPERPILFCELFEVAVATPTAPTAAPDAGPPEPPASAEGVEYRGLCVNCENRHECTMTRPEGGVWHCEEYT